MILETLSFINNRCTNKNLNLAMDEACLNILNKINKTVSLYSIVDSCKECDGILWADLPPNSNTTLVVSTRYPLRMHYIEGNSKLCQKTFKFEQYGHYGWNFSDSICSNLYTLAEPNNPYLPLLAAFMICIISIILVKTTKFITKIVSRYISRYLTTENDDITSSEQSDLLVPLPLRVTRMSTRVKSVDAFRGCAILLMIFVNNGGGKYTFFNHSPWYGFTFADIVLPFFAWIMGVTAILSIHSQFRLSISRIRIIIISLKRTLILIFMGLIINGLNDNNHAGGVSLGSLRYPGILQLLGITYFLCVSIEVVGMKTQRNLQYGRFAFMRDILDAWVQWLIILVLVSIHLMTTFLLPVPGCPKGYLGPGGYELHGEYKNCTAGAAGYIDRTFFRNHVYNHTHNPIYGYTLPHDPEGIMNTLSAVLIVALGMQAGRILFSYYLHIYSKIIRWIAWAVILGLAAGILSIDLNGSGMAIIPISKNMMTISYVLTSSCLAFMTFTILYYVIDHLKIWDGTPFVYAGANSIFLYMGHYFTMNVFPWAWKITYPTHASLLAMNLWTTVLWTLIAYCLYKKGIIISV